MPQTQEAPLSVVGKPTPRVDGPLKVSGQAMYTSDFSFPGMLYAVVERNPRFQGKVKSFDDTETKKVPGVKHVIPVKMSVFNTFREGVAVVADSIWSAMQGRKVLKVGFEDATELIICAVVYFFVGIAAEVVGSTPTRSISYCEGTTVLN